MQHHRPCARQGVLQLIAQLLLTDMQLICKLADRRAPAQWAACKVRASLIFHDESGIIDWVRESNQHYTSLQAAAVFSSLVASWRLRTRKPACRPRSVVCPPGILPCAWSLIAAVPHLFAQLPPIDFHSRMPADVLPSACHRSIICSIFRNGSRGRKSIPPVRGSPGWQQ